MNKKEFKDFCNKLKAQACAKPCQFKYSGKDKTIYVSNFFYNAVQEEYLKSKTRLKIVFVN